MRGNGHTHAGLTIGELAAGAGVGIDTVRYYMRRGLIPEPARTAHGHRRFDEDGAGKLRFVVHAKAHGFTLSEIAELWDLLGDSATTCADLRDAIDQAAERHRDAVASSKRALGRLASLRARCSCDGPASCAPHDPAGWVPDPDAPPDPHGSPKGGGGCADACSAPAPPPAGKEGDMGPCDCDDCCCDDCCRGGVCC